MTGFKITVLVVALIVGAWLAEAWSIMLLVGIAHDDWWPLMPPMGFHAAESLALVTILFTVGASLLGGARKTS